MPGAALPTGALLYWDVAWGVLTAAAGFLLMAYRWRRLDFLGEPLRRWIAGWAAQGLPARLDWRHAVLGTALVFGVGAALQSGAFACGSGTDDVGAFVASGQALRTGQDPFLVAVCGNTVQVPYGLAAALLNALGSFGGRFGVWMAWMIPALLLVPLTWSLAGRDRRYLTLWVTASIVFFPVVAEQIDGASNALVPVLLLVSVSLGSRAPVPTALVVGFLASARFPALFPLWAAASGPGSRRLAWVVASAAAFAMATAVAWFLWGSTFVDIVFLGQVHRLGYSLNEFGLLIPNGWLPPANVLTGVQVGAILTVLTFVQLRPLAPLRSISLVLVVIALSTNFLAFNFLIWLLPVAFLGARPQRLLYAVGVVGAVDYSWALAILSLGDGIRWPSELFALVISGLLVALLYVLVRAPAAPKTEAREGG